MRVAERLLCTRVGCSRQRREGIELYSILRYLVHSFLSYILGTLYNDIIVSEYNERYIGRVEYRVFYSSPSDRRTGRPRAYTNVPQEDIFKTHYQHHHHRSHKLHFRFNPSIRLSSPRSHRWPRNLSRRGPAPGPRALRPGVSFCGGNLDEWYAQRRGFSMCWPRLLESYTMARYLRSLERCIHRAETFGIRTLTNLSLSHPMTRPDLGKLGTK